MNLLHESHGQWSTLFKSLSYIANTVCRFSPFSSSFPNFLIFSCHCPLCWQDYSRLRPACFERKPGVFLWTCRSVVTETPSLSVFPLTGGFCHHRKHKTSCICSHSNSLVGDLWQELCSASVTIPHAWDSLATRRRLAFLSHPSAVQEGSPMLQPSLRCCKPLSTSCFQVWGRPVTPCTLQETICQSLPVLASRSCPSSKLGLGAWSRLTKRFFILPVLGWPRQQQARLSGPHGSQIDSHHMVLESPKLSLDLGVVRDREEDQLGTPREVDVSEVGLQRFVI